MYWKQIIFLLIIIILIAIIHFNLIRYFSLYVTPCQSYIKDYTTKKKINTKSKIILSITTTPKRIRHIYPTIKSLLHQTVRVDEIALNLPNKCKGQKYSVPKYLTDIVTVYKCGRDYGKGTNYMPTLLREGDRNTIIIMLKDNIIYGEDFIETLLFEHLKNTDTCLYTNNSILITPRFVHSDILHYSKVDFDDNVLMRFVKVPKKKIDYTEEFASLF